MKVLELIERLKQYDQDAIVIMSKDGEGNNYSPLADMEDGVYAAESTWSGQWGYDELTPKMIEQGFTEEDLLEGVKGVCLWPTN